MPIDTNEVATIELFEYYYQHASMRLKVAAIVSNLLLYCTDRGCMPYFTHDRMFIAHTATMTIGSDCPEVM